MDHGARPDRAPGSIAAIGLMALILSADGDVPTRASVVVYALGMWSMLTVSTIYHRWVHTLRARCTWRRADHAMIFAAIAGSGTPIVSVALPGTNGVVLIGAIWTAAAVGGGCKLARWEGGDRAGAAMYAATSALCAIAVPWIWARHGIAPAALVLAGGVVYVVGAVCFARGWPTLRAGVFSYHEVWHVFTMVAAATHLVAVWMLVT